MSAQQTKLLYKLLLRSAQINIKTDAGKQFMMSRVRTAFRENKILDAKTVQKLQTRAFGVLMASMSDEDKKLHGL
jgi:hypothetical protein